MPTNLDLANLRRDYRQHGLLESDLATDPVAQFGKWLSEAAEH